jgi:hypothetical protein
VAVRVDGRCGGVHVAVVVQRAPGAARARGQDPPSHATLGHRSRTAAPGVAR